MPTVYMQQIVGRMRQFKNEKAALSAAFSFGGERGICTYPNFLLYSDILRVFNSVLTELLTTLNLV